jgi:hypothetical protein
MSLLSCDVGAGSETPSTTTSDGVPSNPEAANGPTASPHGLVPADVIAATAWFVGRWSGDYIVEKHRVERPSVQIAWMRDDGTRFSGRGTLSFEVDQQGRLLGSGDGALGGQRVVGSVEAGALTFRLEGTPSLESMGGVVSCGKVAAGREAVCSVSATSGDGNFVRAGTARLRQVLPAAP